MYIIKWGNDWWVGRKSAYSYFSFVTNIIEAATYESKEQAEEYVKFLKENMDVAEYTILELTIEEK